jgi:hypothetical protein
LNNLFVLGRIAPRMAATVSVRCVCPLMVSLIN